MIPILKAFGYDSNLERKEKYTYIITAFSFLLVLLFLIVYILIIRSAIVISLTTVCLSALGLVFLFLRKRMFTTAKRLYLLAYFLQLIGLVFFWFPVESNLDAFLYTFAPISFFIYDIQFKKEKNAIIIINCIALTMLLLSEILPLENPLIPLSRQNIRLFSTMSAVSVLGSITIVFYLYAWNLMNLQKELALMANTDSLTSTFNRRTLYREGESLITFCRKYDQPFSVLILDIDFFKRINDEFGHPAGDSVLVQLTDVISENIRQNDILSRFGGEEFVVILKRNRINSAVKVAAHIKDAVEQNHFILPDEQIISITVSIGVTEFEQRHQSFQDIFNDADTALYKAKESGRNLVVAFDIDHL